MSRLVHSNGAYLRSMQISGAQLFAFVEGGLDRPFVERIFKGVAPGVRYQIIAAKELPGSTGGKTRLVEWFKELRRKGKLASQNWGKKIFSLFFLDKDADDFKNNLLRSEHLVYTSTYDVEGLLFTCADVHTAFADAALITSDQAKELLPSVTDWLKIVTQNWTDWVTLCLISNFENVNCGCGFDRLSDVNPDRLGPADANRVEQYKLQIRTKLGLSAEDFTSIYLSYMRRVKSAIKRGEYLRYFKGKWLHNLLQLHCERAKKVEDWNVQTIGDKLTIALLGQVGNTRQCSCCSTFYHRLQPGIRFVSQ